MVGQVYKGSVTVRYAVHVLSSQQVSDYIDHLYLLSQEKSNHVYIYLINIYLCK